jgi:glycosyltransferase involved in cell wall biosynthesis
MKVLLISYFFSPMKNGGVHRPLKLAKYLPEFGCDVTVLTHSYKQTNLNNPNILRVYDINREGLHKLQFYPYKVIQKGLNYLGIYKTSYEYWKKNVLRYEEQIINRVNPDIIFVTYPPIETLELGVYLSEKYQIPLVSDFRDGLLFESIENNRINKFPHLKRGYERVEKDIVNKSKALITVSKPITDYFINKYDIKNVFTIPNGFDPDDFIFENNFNILDNNKFNIVYTGRFSLSDQGTKIDKLFKSVELLVKNYPELKDIIKIHLIGEYTKNEYKIMKNLIDDNIIKIYGLMDREHALYFQKNADLLLLIVNIKRTSVATSKLFEYLYARKPILALAEGTFAGDIVKQTETGWVVHPNNTKAIYNILLKIITDNKFYSAIKPNKKEILKFSRKEQAKAISSILKNLL